jgi:hypothetical protein
MRNHLSPVQLWVLLWRCEGADDADFPQGLSDYARERANAQAHAHPIWVPSSRAHQVRAIKTPLMENTGSYASFVVTTLQVSVFQTFKTPLVLKKVWRVGR